MPNPPTKERRILLDGVEILFSWCGDRWSHTVVFPHIGNAATWRSVEGPRQAGGDAAWPASPVIVELSPVPSADAIVGVGRAGKSHYSVSFTARPADGFTAAQRPRLLVECACRIQEPPGWLGSTYEHTAAAGRPPSLVSIPAASDPASTAPLPRTVTWSYVVEPAGPIAGERHG